MHNRCLNSPVHIRVDTYTMARSFFTLLAIAATAAGIRSGPPPSLTERGLSSTPQNNTSSSSCQHGPTSRQCWSEYDINTNYYDTVVYANKTVEYWLTLQEIDCALDGYLTKCQTANGTMRSLAIS